MSEEQALRDLGAIVKGVRTWPQVMEGMRAGKLVNKLQSVGPQESVGEPTRRRLSGMQQVT